MPSVLAKGRRSLAVAAVAAASLGAGVSASAQTPQAEFQYSAITGSNSVINVTRVPVTNSSGDVTYWDMTLSFNVSDAGTPTAGTVSITMSKALKVSSFQPGPYVWSTNNSYGITVAGPGVASGGTTAWSSSSTGAPCGFPSTAQWWTGPVASNPLASRIQAAKIKSKDFSFGIIGNGCGSWPFHPGDLVGLAQVANTLTFSDFTKSGGGDQSISQAAAVFTLSQ